MKRTVLLIASLAFVAVSCTEQPASDPTTTTTAVPAAPTSTTEASTTTTAAEEPLIFISGFQFQGVDTVSVGTAVEVENRDTAPHTWTSVDAVFDSGNLGNGDTFTFTFDTPGEYEFFCSIHPEMEGSITVQP